MTSVRMTEVSDVAAASAAVGAEVDDWRLRPPQPVAGQLRRNRLVDPLVAADQTRVVVVTAPAGYGKSTVLRQWSDDDPRPFVWLRCDASDADAVLFLRRVAVAVDPAGAILRTNSPWVDDRGRVTLLDVEFDRLLEDDAALAQLRGARTRDEAQSAFARLPGLKVSLEPEIVIEFTPTR